MLLLDCCYAGAFAAGSKGDEGVHLKEEFEGRGRAILTASNAIEYAWEGETLSGQGKPSVFTSAIVDGLESGDADRDGDGKVSLYELHEYVTERMLAAASKQTPLKWELGIEGALYVAHNPRAGTALLHQVLQVLQHPLAGVRAGAVSELAQLLESNQPGVRRVARDALEQLLHHDDSFMVRQAASRALNLPGDRSADVPTRLAHDESMPEVAGQRLDTEHLVAPNETALEGKVELRRRHVIVPRETLRLSVGEDILLGPYGFNPDGSCFALCTKNNAHLFDVRQEREIGRIKFGGMGTVFAFSPDGSCLATSSNDKTVVVWDVRNDEEIARLRHRDSVHSASFSPDGGMLATAEGPWGGSDHGHARLWDLSNGQQVALLRHEGTVFEVAFSPDGSCLATASGDKFAALWDPSNGRQIAKLKHQGTVFGVHFSPNGTRIRTSTSFTDRLWDAADQREIVRVKYRRNSNSLTFSPDSTRVVTLSRGEAGRLTDAINGRMIALLDQLDAFAAAFSPDGGRFATTGSESSRIWDSHDGHEIRRLEHSADLLAAGPGGTWLATHDDDGRLRLWNGEDEREIGHLQHDGAARLLDIAPDETCIATQEKVDDGVRLRLWQLSSAGLEP
jgi:WD40 repeat protein